MIAGVVYHRFSVAWTADATAGTDCLTLCNSGATEPTASHVGITPR